MQRSCLRPIFVLACFTLLFSAPYRALAVSSDNILLGVTWGQSELVSFDPYAGAITTVHAYLNPAEGFRGLAYDSNRGKLYALSQGEWNLYEIDPLTLDIELIRKLNFDTTVTWGSDIGGLTYSPLADALYTVLSHWDASYHNIWSELVKIDGRTGDTTQIGFIADGFCDSLSYSETDGQIYGLLLRVDDPWTVFPFQSSLVRIDPYTGMMTELLDLPYRTIFGLAKKPAENVFYSWINADRTFYGETNLDTQVIRPLANSDVVDVASDAMMYKTFPVSSLVPVDDHVMFKRLNATMDVTSDTTDCPFPEEYAGKLSFDALLKNKSDSALSGLLIKIDQFGQEQGSVILNAVGGPGGAGSFLMVPKQEGFADGLLASRESVHIPFVVCFKDKKPFHISVSILGVVR